MGKARPKPMTNLKAWADAKKLARRMKSELATETIWFKCIACDDTMSSLTDIQFGKHQRNMHITRYHRMTVEIYDEICGNKATWCEKQIIRRFKQILMNVHKEDYDNRLAEIRRKSLMERRPRASSSRKTI